jgi:hypothetical protein
LETALDAVHRIADPHVRARATTAMVRRVGELPDDTEAFATRIWTNVRDTHVDRADLFDLVAASGWWIHQTGGAASLKETADSPFDISCWWR